MKQMRIQIGFLGPSSSINNWAHAGWCFNLNIINT